jgi:hypothetical protein
LEAGEIVEEGAPDQLLSDENGRFYKMYMDQRLETMSISTPSTSTPPSTPTKKIAPVQLNRFASLAPADFNNLQQQESAETRRKAWLRSSLGASRRSFGRSYSVRSIDRQKMALPVLSRPRSMMERKYSFRKNVMEIPVDNESIDSDLTEVS